MNRFLYCLMTVAAAAILWSCGSDEPVIQEDPAPTAITLSPESSNLTADASDISLSVTAPVRPSVSGAPSWITVVDGTYNNYKITYTLKVAANTTYETRSATITLTAGSLTKTVSVTQAGTEALELSDNSFTVSASAAELKLDVVASSAPKVTGAPDWITVKAGTYSSYKIQYTLNLSANTGTEERNATLTFTSGSLSGTVTVTQAAPVVIQAALTNPNASSAAQKVYAFLKEQAGLKILSGVESGGTANNNDNVNAVYSKTGKHPAVAGYDYIFLQYSPTPSSWDWKVNYSDISAAKEQWKNNGLVSFMWHWYVPESKEAWEKGVNDYDFAGYNFYSEKTPFSISRALVAGNWENDFILKDIEKVAGYLKLLQEEGIPVLWRPLHEAAGNYNLYGSNCAWFWWGKGGADACKKLWKLLRDKLEGEYGLDNLIWVWTLDAVKGAESDYASWYPGNDLVDIVGVDIYADDTDAKSRQYQAAVALSGGSKLVTISECGNIPDPEKCFSDNETWNWFLTWNLEDYNLNTDSYWKRLMSSDRVLTRETMPSLK